MKGNYVGIGIVFGAGLGIVFGQMFFEPSWSIIGGAALGLLVGAVYGLLKIKKENQM